MTVSWYTITIVRHAEHPRYGEVASKPTELIGCTVLPSMAATILRGMADEIDPPKPKQPVMRGCEESARPTRRNP